MFKQIVLATLGLLTVGTAEAESIRVDKLDDQTIAYIQRGWPYDLQACAIDEINFLQETGIARRVIVTFDEDQPFEIKFKYSDGFIRICKQDVVIELRPGYKPLVIDY